MDFKYAIFDLDGTLLDSQRLWDFYERTVLQDYFGIDMFNDENGVYIPFTGLRDMFDKAVKRSGIKSTPDIKELYKRIYALMAEVYKSAKIGTMPHALEFLQKLKADGVKTALATATPIYMCKPALDRYRLSDYLDELVCVDDVGKNKFHPDVFDRALQLIGGNKTEAMVFEDSLYAAETLKNNCYRYTIIEERANAPFRDSLMNGCEKYIKSYKELL